MDRYWNVLMTNDSAPRFFNCFIDMSRRKGPRNMLHLMFDSDGMRPFVEHWDEVAGSLIHRLRAEATGRVIDEKSKELIAGLLAYPEVKPGPNPGATLGRDKTRQSHRGLGDEGNSATGTAPTLPMIPISFRKSETVLN
jgi:MmyB-like transcription regulator ligand binding domain